MQETRYHVVLDGRRLGPYDRRTIVGMRVRKTLTSRHMLEASDGARLTVAELVRGTLPVTPLPPAESPAPAPTPARAGRPVVQATPAAEPLAAPGPAAGRTAMPRIVLALLAFAGVLLLAVFALQARAAA